jgi:hypothetical protein
MKIPNKNALIINATAGHGKDYVLDSLSDIIKTKIISLPLSKPVKSIVAENLPQNVKDLFPEKSNMDILNTLKDDRHDINVFGDMNMRKFLQVFLGNEVLRGINSDINMLLTAQSMKEEIEKNDNFVFVCPDNRYTNEQEFLLKFNQINEFEKKDFLDNYMFNNKTEHNDFEIINIIEKGLNKYIKSNQDKEYMSRLIKGFMKAHKPLMNVENTSQDYSNILKDFDFKTIGKMNKEEGFNLGLINIFRPLKPLKQQNIKSDLSINDIKQSAMSFNNLSLQEVNNIEKIYNSFNLDFNYNNVTKYSFLRADPNHASERQLDGRKPEAFINNPKDSGLISIHKQINEVFNQKSIKNNTSIKYKI